MGKNIKYTVKYNLVTDTNKVIEDDSYKIYEQSKDYVILNSHDKQYSTKIEIVKNINS